MNEHPDEIPAAENSALAQFRASRERAKKNLHLDLLVPRYTSPRIGVRYAPLPKRVIDTANKAIAESSAADAEVIEKAVVLSKACVGVFLVGDDGKPVGDPSSWPKFDQQLAGWLDLPDDCGAVTVVKELYLAEGDIIAAVLELGAWSAQAERLHQEEFAGN